MRVSEIRACDECGKSPQGAFWVVRLSQAFISPNEFDRWQRTARGVVEILGGSERPGAACVANCFAGDPHVAKVMGEENPKLWTSLLLCMDCAVRLLGSPLQKVWDAQKRDEAAAESDREAGQPVAEPGT